MISLTKKIVYGVAITGSIALAVPALLDARKPEVERKIVERPADGTMDTLGSLEALETTRLAATVESTNPLESHGQAETPVGATGIPTSSPAAAVDANTTLDALARLERSLAELDTFGGKTGFDRRRRARAREDLDDSDLDTSDVTSTTPRFNEARRASDTTAVEQREALEALHAFVAEMPMRGLLRGENDAVAMFGGRVVRVGDALVPDRAVITTIDARGVLVDVLGKEVRLDIPPVLPRPRPRDDAQAAGAGEADRQPPGAAAGADSVVEPAIAHSAGKEPAQP